MFFKVILKIMGKSQMGSGYPKSTICVKKISRDILNDIMKFLTMKTAVQEL